MARTDCSVLTLAAAPALNDAIFDFNGPSTVGPGRTFSGEQSANSKHCSANQSQTHCDSQHKKPQHEAQGKYANSGERQAQAGQRTGGGLIK